MAKVAEKLHLFLGPDEQIGSWALKLQPKSYVNTPLLQLLANTVGLGLASHILFLRSKPFLMNCWNPWLIAPPSFLFIKASSIPESYRCYLPTSAITLCFRTRS